FSNTSGDYPISGVWQTFHNYRLSLTDYRSELFLSLRSVTSAHQNGLVNPCVPTAFQVTQLVADHVTARKVQPEFIAGHKKKVRRGLSACAGTAGLLRRDINFLKIDAQPAHFFFQALIY